MNRGLFAKYWQKIVLRTKHTISSPRARKLERALVAARDEKQAVLVKMSSVETELESLRSKDEKQITELKQRLNQIETERKTVHHQLQTLQHSLTEAVTRLESTERQVGFLDAKLEKARSRYQSEMQEARDNTRRHARRLNWALLASCCALLMGTAASVTKIYDPKNNTQMLVELSMDIKDIKLVMEQHLAHSQSKISGDHIPHVTDETDASQASARLVVQEGAQETDTFTRRPDNKPIQRRQPTLEPDFLSDDDLFGSEARVRTRKEMWSFFEQNALRSDVISLGSGLQYKVLSRGAGKSPKAIDTVVIDYRGFTPEGTEFDSSFVEAEPVTVKVNELLPGISEALLHMKEGAQWEVYVRPSLAYRGTRKRGRSGFVPRIYTVELKKIIEDS